MRWSRRVLSHRDEGFTMAELVAAMVVIAIILVAVLAVQVSAFRTIADARMRQEATAYANEAAEQMRAIPWNVLSKGMAYDFEAAAGGDSHVSGGNLELDGITVPLVIATETQDQNLDRPWPPLFDSSGSNMQTRLNPSGQSLFTIRGYVTELPADPSLAVGLAVVVEWEDNRGRSQSTTIWSSAYRGGGCGNLDTQPYLGACQALLDSSSTSGNVVSRLTASTNPPLPEVPVETPILGPLSGSGIYSISMRTAGVATAISSQQTTIARAIAQYGGTTIDDNDPATQPDASGWENGYGWYQLAASDDIVSVDLPPNPPDIVVVPTSSDESTRYVSGGPFPFVYRGLSDYLRTSTLDASTTTSCMAGIPAGQPCARAGIVNYPAWDGGSGYILLDVDSTVIRTSRRLAESGTNNENAWAARFITASGTVAGVGCQAITGEGCVSAGANRTMAPLSIGTVVTGSGSWTGDAPLGIVIVKGSTGCASGLTSSILVQRGASQKTTAATTSRCGAIDYWNGSSYSTLTVTASTSESRDTTPVTWSNGNYTVVAQAHISVDRATSVTSGPADCVDDACFITADAGVITIVATYTVTQPGADFVLTSWTVINPPQATASYKKAPSA